MVYRGKNTKKFIEKIKDITGSPYVLPVSNGTLGLYVALLSMNLPRGSEVLIPSFTFFGSASSVYFAGLKPVFVDVDPKTMATYENYLQKVTKKTSAIMPVHIYGLSCDMDPIITFAKKKLKIIEDAAQAIGVKYRGKHCGTFGDTEVISFFADKTIAMGEGGNAILTNNKGIYKKLKLIRNQGRPNSGTFIHPEFGMNFRITDMQSAIGYAQLKRLKEKNRQ